MKKIKFTHTFPEIRLQGEHVLISDGQDGERIWKPLETLGKWTFMTFVEIGKVGKAAVFEDLSADGGICYVDPEGRIVSEFGKRLESTKDEPEKAWLGFPKNVVCNSNADLMGKELLSRKEEPSCASVKSCIPPVRINYQDGSNTIELPHTFIGTRESNDVIPLYYGIRHCVSRINHGYVSGEIEKAVDAHTVSEGLLGGWLPVVVMNYPVGDGSAWEFTAFARTHSQTAFIQPAWYRYVKIRDGRVEEIHYYDSYLPYPLQEEPEARLFYEDLYSLREYWKKELKGGMELQVSAEAWVPDFCRHAMVLEMICRVGNHPRYGLVSQNYGSAEHDGFQDILTASVDCYLEWGMTETARAYMEYYLENFVRENGQLEYRGPETGQYGRMLTEIAQYYDYTGDSSLCDRYEGRILAITEILKTRRDAAGQLPEDAPDYGMIRGRHEADISFVFADYKKVDFEQPYFSNTTEACRGFHDIGHMWQKIGTLREDKDLIFRGEELIAEAERMKEDLIKSLKRSVLTDRGEAFLPSIAGSRKYYYDYPYRSTPDSFDDNRVWCEMMHSGMVPREYVALIMKNGSHYNGMKLGIFGNRSCVVAFICYGQAYGLIQHDMIREFLMFYYAHALHLHTRGTWTAFECMDIDRERAHSTGHCPPAQVTIPTITKWMLVFEEPFEETLWLCKATPEEWLSEGEYLSVNAAPTRWGNVDLFLESRAGQGLIVGKITLPEKIDKVILRLRLPENRKIGAVYINDREIRPDYVDARSILLPSDARGDVRLSVKLA